MINQNKSFSNTVKKSLFGSVEENNLQLGMLLFQQKGAVDNLYISKVGVLPAFRRRGIARKLAEPFVELKKELKRKFDLLDAIFEKLPVFSLKKDIGLTHSKDMTGTHLNPDNKYTYWK